MIELTFDCATAEISPCGRNEVRVTATGFDYNDSDNIFAEIKDHIDKNEMMDFLGAENVKEYFGLTEVE